MNMPLGDDMPLGADRVLLVTGGVGLSGPALLAAHQAVGFPQPVPAIVGLLLLCFAPGLAVARVMRVEDPLMVVVLAIATSLALDVVVSLVLFYTHLWSWLAGVGILGAFTVLLAGLGLWWTPSRRTPIGDQTGISPAPPAIVGPSVGPPVTLAPAAQQGPTQNADESRTGSEPAPPCQYVEVLAAVAEARRRAKAVGAAAAATRAAFAPRGPARPEHRDGADAS